MFGQFSLEYGATGLGLGHWGFLLSSSYLGDDHLRFLHRFYRAFTTGNERVTAGEKVDRFIACDVHTCTSTHFQRLAIQCYSLGGCPRCDERIVFGARSWCSWFFFLLALFQYHDAETLEH